MSEIITLTTGQTCGLTGLSMQTVQRYVRQYPMGFSEPARRPARGRRFNGDDIKHLLLINHLLTTKRKDQIEKALLGEIDSPDFALFEIMNFMHMARNLAAMQKHMDELLEKIETENKNQEFWSSKIRKTINSHAEHIKALEHKRSLDDLGRKMKNEPIEHPELEKKTKFKRSLGDRVLDIFLGPDIR